jgi:hypothetical protein
LGISLLHETPQPPQLLGSWVGSTQLPEQLIVPAGQAHAPLAQTRGAVHVLFGVSKLQPFASFEHVTSVVLLAHVGPAVPRQTGSALQEQVAPPAGPVQLSRVAQLTGVP